MSKRGKGLRLELQNRIWRKQFRDHPFENEGAKCRVFFILGVFGEAKMLAGDVLDSPTKRNIVLHPSQASVIEFFFVD